jgi:hypothetical protein
MKRILRCVVAFSVFVVFLALLVPSLTVKAQLIVPGVQPGESFTYGTPDGSPWVWMAPNGAQPMPQWEPFVNMSTITFNITTNWEEGAPYTEVMFNETFKYNNDTVIKWPGQTIDVSSGMGAGASWIIAPGLESGDHIYPGNSTSQTINQTMINNTFWPDRDVCVLNITTAAPLENSSSSMAAEEDVFIWDRSTGVLLAGFEEAAAYDPTTKATVEGGILYELISNNVGIPMQYPQPTDWTPIYIIVAIGVIVILGVVIALVVTRRSKKKPKRLKER